MFGGRTVITTRGGMIGTNTNKSIGRRSCLFCQPASNINSCATQHDTMSVTPKEFNERERRDATLQGSN